MVVLLVVVVVVVVVVVIVVVVLVVGQNFSEVVAPAEEEVLVVVRGSADRSLPRPTSRCRRTESIVSLERGVCSCAELQVFFCYSG